MLARGVNICPRVGSTFLGRLRPCFSTSCIWPAIRKHNNGINVKSFYRCNSSKIKCFDCSVVLVCMRALYCIVLLYCIILLYYVVLCCIVLFCCIMLCYVALYCIELLYCYVAALYYVVLICVRELRF